MSSLSFPFPRNSRFLSILFILPLSGIAADSNSDQGMEGTVPENSKGTEHAFTGISPQDVVIGDGSCFVASSTGESLQGWNRRSGKTFSYPLEFSPVGICPSKDGKTLYITDGQPNGHVYVFSLDKKQVIKSFPAGFKPGNITLTKEGSTLLILNSLANRISLVDIENGALKAITMVREPRSIAVSKATGMAAVANLLPTQPSTSSHISAAVSLFNPEYPEDVKHILLANGCQSIEGIDFSPDGKYIYVTHLLSRFQYPVTQLERGWVNTNALSLIDAETKEYKGTVLLDSIDRGAANPRGITVSSDGNTALIALSGTHELLTIDLKLLLERLHQCTWNPASANDLTFANDLVQRIPLGGLSPRNVTINGNEAYIPCYFSGNVIVVDPVSGKVKDKKNLGGIPLTGVRKGEFLFSDAGICFQNWQSCVSCHPDGRADGLNWDQQNDGMGNPKNTKSMVFSHVTAPCMITGIRATAELAVRKGIMHTLLASVAEEDAQAIDEYLKSLRPEISPYLVHGKLSASAKRGETVYSKAQCNECHSGKYLTDQQAYDVGTGIDEYKGFSFDTPTLREIWRTAPYLYDGRARNLREVFTDFNKADQHGTTSNLTEQELHDLEQYILTL